MANRNIEMNIKTSSGYDLLYPKVLLNNVTGVLPVANGGTGTTSLSNLQSSMGISNVGLYDWSQIYSGNINQNTQIPFNQNLNTLQAFAFMFKNVTLTLLTGTTSYANFSVDIVMNSSSNNFSGIQESGNNSRNFIEGGFANDAIPYTVNMNSFNLFFYKTACSPNYDIYGRENNYIYFYSGGFRIQGDLKVSNIIGNINFSLEKSRSDVTGSFSANLTVYIGNPKF